MLTLQAIEALADRIERAYLRRHPHWRQGCSNPRVWATAAVALLRMHRDDPAIPLDPELYVASQSFGPPLADPWADLAQAGSTRRYRRRVHQILRKLRGELHAEVRLAEGRVRKGSDIEAVLLSKGRSFSPLGRFIVAYRAGRPDLMERFRPKAQDQHRACPLYRHACTRLLPRDVYPVLEILAGMEIHGWAASGIPQYSLN